MSNSNIGNSTRLGYDVCAYADRLKESTDPLSYRLYSGFSHSCNNCLSTLGPRSTFHGDDVSTPVGQTVATAQQLADVESILTNRNLRLTKCRKDEANPIDVNKMGVKHARICNQFLDPDSTKLSYPVYNYRELAIDRFYNLDRNPQLPIFWNFASNSRLEATDNYKPEIPNIITDKSLPKVYKGHTRKC